MEDGRGRIHSAVASRKRQTRTIMRRAQGDDLELRQGWVLNDLVDETVGI